MNKGQDSENWRLPAYEPGSDEMWDRLGPDWRAIDGVRADVRVYVTWSDEGGRSAVSGLCIKGTPVSADLLRSIPVSRLENLPAALGHATSQEDFLSELVPLVRRKGDDPEEFAARVAYYYRMFAATTDKPALALANHSGVPLGTARGWIREARLRGKLPPGVKGKPG
ncbi:hypothetical protein ACFV1N_17685 [Streptosporangium canum]|uniref:hypothetical protein n=1 Tax=Streptosporangium canum TaxID=324952 RepID=UPI0036AC2F83